MSFAQSNGNVYMFTQFWSQLIGYWPPNLVGPEGNKSCSNRHQLRLSSLFTAELAAQQTKPTWLHSLCHRFCATVPIYLLLFKWNLHDVINMPKSVLILIKDGLFNSYIQDDVFKKKTGPDNNTLRNAIEKWQSMKIWNFCALVTSSLGHLLTGLDSL